MVAESPKGTQLLARAVQVLRAVARIQRAGASLAEITRAVGLSRSTTFRIVHFLKEERLLEYDERQGGYFIGALAFELGLAARGQSALLKRWQPRLDQISAQTRMTAYLVARSDSEVVCLASAEASAIVRAVSLAVGERLPLGVGAGSLAILSSLEDGEIETVLRANAEKMKNYGSGGLTPETLWERIEAAREQGFAHSSESVARGVWGVGIVLPPQDGPIVLAASVSAPTSQFDRHKLAGLAQMLHELTASQ